MPGYRKTRVIGPTTLAAVSATLDTPAVNVAGAKAIIFIVSASNSVAPQGPAYHFSQDGATWVTTPQAAFFATSNDIGAVSLVGGRTMFVVPATGIPVLLAGFIRARFTGNAGASPTNDILDFTVDVVVVPSDPTVDLQEG